MGVLVSMPSYSTGGRTTACHYSSHHFCDDGGVNRTERLHALTESLRRAGARGRTAQQLAEEFEVTSRTIKRDLAALEAGGLPVWGRTGPGGGYGLAAGSSLPPVNFTAAQALALTAAVAATTQAPFSDSARTAARKVLDVLDPAGRRRASDLSQRVWIDVGPGASRRVMSVLEQSLIDQLTVNLTYTDVRGRTTRREVEPMIFALSQGRWLLVAWCRLRDDVRWFDLSRIQGATATRHPCTGHHVSEIGTPPQQARPVDV
jgi:predicted DNA-binding transcriptional regulator YafY